ncbi:hypothetical protein [Psychrobacter sp. PAMC 21119]|uniref:hypothetical protein n=1 Tax=Psychrobacter sp. PAMC 21119 TaxID=1112209 RepID=UPI000288ECDE|nr:hypothetical protein [Psychrobacter sp. PAMC 21119]
METWNLIALTISALAISSIAALFVFNRTKSIQRINTSANFNSLAAEDLMGVVIGVPLNEIVSAGDTIEIVIKVNGHSIAGSEYSVKRWYGRLKLTRKTGD